jgi:hypothetical protein
MPARSKVLGNRSIGGEKSLRVPWGLEPLHPSLALPGGLMGVLRMVVEVAVLTMLHTREDLPLRGAVALQFIGDEDTRYVLAPLEELAEKLLGGLLIPPPLYQNVEHDAVLIHGPPQIMPFLVDRDEHFIQMPLICS